MFAAIALGPFHLNPFNWSQLSQCIALIWKRSHGPYGSMFANKIRKLLSFHQCILCADPRRMKKAEWWLLKGQTFKTHHGHGVCHIIRIFCLFLVQHLIVMIKITSYATWNDLRKSLFAQELLFSSFLKFRKRLDFKF